MLRYEADSPIVARSQIVRVEKRVRATRIGAQHTKLESEADGFERVEVAENWFERAWRKLGLGKA